MQLSSAAESERQPQSAVQVIAVDTMMLVVPASCCLGDDCCLESASEKSLTPLKSLEEQLDSKEPVVRPHDDVLLRRVADAQVLMRFGHMPDDNDTSLEWFLGDVPDTNFYQPRPSIASSDSSDNVAYE